LVYGAGTDFANTLSTGSAIQAVDAYGTTTNLGFATATFGYVSVAVANTVVSGNVIGTTGNALTLAVDQPVSFSANIGTLVAGTTYFVKTTANAAAFTVSSTLGGAPKVMTAASGTPDALQDSITLGANALATIGGLGQNYVYANDEAGFIVRQKGKTKYLVQGGTTGLVAQCYTANVANTALTPNTMNILSTDAASATAYVSSVNDYNSEVFPTQVAAGSLSVGTLYTIYSSGTTDWTVCGAASNMTGVTFLATATGTGTGTAVVNSVNPDVIATFNTAYAANTYDGQPNPIVVIASA
jgi:DhnA family fructose-bisphosphate aldolase class Ia